MIANRSTGLKMKNWVENNHVNITLSLVLIIFAILFGLLIFVIVYYKIWIRIRTIYNQIRIFLGGRRHTIPECGKTDTLTGDVKPVESSSKSSTSCQISSVAKYSSALPEEVVLESRIQPLEQIEPVENLAQDTSKPTKKSKEAKSKRVNLEF